MLVKLLGNTLALKKAIERNPDSIEVMDRHLTNVFIWTATVANCSHLDLFRAISEKYALGCPRCHHFPCLLAQDQVCERNDLPWGNLPGVIPTRLDGWQEHLAKMYPNNFTASPLGSLKFAASKLYEEVGELISSTDPRIKEEVGIFSHHDTPDDSLEPWRGEIADVLAWSFAVAEGLKRLTGDYSIERSLREKYSNGCWYCKSQKCICPKETTLLGELYKWQPP